MRIVRMGFWVTLFMWVLFTAFYGFNVWFSNSKVDYGQKYAALEDRRKELELENKLLESEIASASALRHISVKAKEMGFSEPKIMYIK